MTTRETHGVKRCVTEGRQGNRKLATRQRQQGGKRSSWEKGRRAPRVDAAQQSFPAQHGLGLLADGVGAGSEPGGGAQRGYVLSLRRRQLEAAGRLGQDEDVELFLRDAPRDHRDNARTIPVADEPESDAPRLLRVCVVGQHQLAYGCARLVRRRPELVTLHRAVETPALRTGTALVAPTPTQCPARGRGDQPRL
eukprot:gene846-biopygen5195